MEIADIFVVNKADREGADRTVASIEAILSLQTFGPGEWRPPILKTEATTGRGVAELLETIERFRVAHRGRARQPPPRAGRVPASGSCSRSASFATSNSTCLPTASSTR